MATRTLPAARTGQEEGAVLVFDLGGTSLRGAIYNRWTDTVERVRSVPTPRIQAAGELGEVQERVLAAVTSLGVELLQGEAPSAVTVAFAGPVDPRGNAHAAPTIWGGQHDGEIDLKSGLSRLWATARIHVVNDVAAAGYRYVAQYGPDFCVVTVSSGIGHKVFHGARQMSGPSGYGGEIGHLRLDLSDLAPRCECGLRGHLGALASGRAVVAEARRQRLPEVACLADEDVARLIARSCRAGQPWACDLVHEAGRWLGQAIAALHLAVGVERFVLVGGFGLGVGEHYRTAVVQGALASSWDIGFDWDAAVVLGHPDGLCGLIGAGQYATKYLPKAEVPMQPAPASAAG